MTINLIDARRGLHDKCLELFANKNIAEQIYRYLCDGIEDCAEVEPIKHGRWIWVDGVRCSICNHKLQTSGLPSYCPNCGADMRGRENE